MKTYRHKVGDLYKPYKGSYTEGGEELSLLFLLLRKSKSHYCFTGVGSVEEMTEKAGPCLTPDEDGFIWGEKVGKGRFYFPERGDGAGHDYYKCNLMPIKEN